MKKVQADHPETTNQLIRAVVPILTHAPISNETSSLLLKDSFSAKPHDIRSTALFFVSLCCSLTAAFGAVLAKQWLTYYERQGGLKTPPDRARERQRKYEGRRDWYLEGIIETLPTILQLSLLLFLVALINFLWHIHPTVRFITMGFSLVPALFYLFTTTASIFNPNAPFQTRLSIFLRTHFPKLWAHFKTLPIPSNKRMCHIVKILIQIPDPSYLQPIHQRYISHRASDKDLELVEEHHIRAQRALDYPFLARNKLH